MVEMPLKNPESLDFSESLRLQKWPTLLTKAGIPSLLEDDARMALPYPHQDVAPSPLLI